MSRRNRRGTGSRVTAPPPAKNYWRVEHFGYSILGSEVCLYCAVMFDPGEMRWQLVDERYAHPLGAIFPLHWQCAKDRRDNPPEPRPVVWHH